jgi:hypothetical protein
MRKRWWEDVVGIVYMNVGETRSPKALTTAKCKWFLLVMI